MREFISDINIWHCLIILLLLLHAGMYSQLFITPDKVKIRNCIKSEWDLSKPFEIFYWVTTIGAIILTIGIIVIFICKVVLWIS